jgi:hypothetical protein
MNPSSQMLEKLYRLERRIFKEFALEPSNNIHVETLDLANPLASICKIILSDVVSSQLRSKQPGLPIVITTRILVEDRSSSQRYCHLELNSAGREFIKDLFRGLKKKNPEVLIEEFRLSVLKNKDSFCNKYLIDWTGKDEAITGKEYRRRKKTSKSRGNAYKIPFDNSNLETNQDEKFNYVINIEHEFHPDSDRISLTRAHIENFLAKLSVLALHTKKNTKHFSDLQKQATKSAISQVMARNMSHNIGSHVLSKFKDEKEITEVCQKAPNGKSQYLGMGSASRPSSGKPLDNFNPDLTGVQLVAYFNEYLKTRMDFLADIATTDPIMETPMYLVRDLMKGFDKNRILLNRISGVSTDIKFSIKILRDKEEITSTNHSRDPLLSIPNGVLGSQAFYILLENVIRNIFKHANPAANFEIVVKVTDYETNKSFYEVCISNSLSKDAGDIRSLVEARNLAFNDPILKHNRLRDTNLGTIEMDVCAAYLRGLPIVSVDDEKYQLEGDCEKANPPKLIYAHAHKDEHEGSADYTLGYKFYIAKPKEVLVLDDEGTFRIGNNSNTDLLDHGIGMTRSSELNASNIFNHQLLYCTSQRKEVTRALRRYAQQLPKRFVFADRDVKTDTIKNFIQSVWQLYGVQNFKGSYCLIINGDEDEKKEIEIRHRSVQIANSCKGENESFKIFIDNHNKAWHRHAAFNYYDMACSHSMISKLLPKINLDKDSQASVEYIEVVLAKILLLDERLQENIVLSRRHYTAYGNSTPLVEYFSNQRLFIPTKDEVNLNEVSFGQLSDEIDGGTVKLTTADKIRCYIQKHLKDCSFCVIHLGILEKMLPSGGSKSIEDINGIINKLGVDKENREKLVVTSGRGKPANLPSDLLFVPLALIQNAVETVFDKYVLTKILYNARKAV